MATIVSNVGNAVVMYIFVANLLELVEDEDDEEVCAPIAKPLDDARTLLMLLKISFSTFAHYHSIK